MLERRDGPRWQRNSDDDDDENHHKVLWQVPLES